MDSTVFLETQISIKLWCLYLVQHMLHQIKAPQFYTNYLKLISLVMDSSISEVEFNMYFSIFLKFSVLENSRKVFEKSLKSPWIFHKLPCMNPVNPILISGRLMLLFLVWRIDDTGGEVNMKYPADTMFHYRKYDELFMVLLKNCDSLMVALKETDNINWRLHLNHCTVHWLKDTFAVMTIHQTLPKTE